MTCNLHKGRSIEAVLQSLPHTVCSILNAPNLAHMCVHHAVLISLQQSQSSNLDSCMRALNDIKREHVNQLAEVARIA